MIGTVVREADGTISGIVMGSAESAVEGGRGGLVAGEGQTLEQVDLPDAFADLADGEELHRSVRAHLSA